MHSQLTYSNDYRYFAAVLSTRLLPRDSYIESQESSRELRRFKVFIVLRAFAVARDTKSGRVVAPENFDRLQLCSFSQQQMFFPQGCARV